MIIECCCNVCSYVKYVEIKVHSNLQQAQRGGIPGTYSFVRSYLNILLSCAPSPEFEVNRSVVCDGRNEMWRCLQAEWTKRERHADSVSSICENKYWPIHESDLWFMIHVTRQINYTYYWYNEGCFQPSNLCGVTFEVETCVISLCISVIRCLPYGVSNEYQSTAELNWLIIDLVTSQPSFVLSLLMLAVIK